MIKRCSESCSDDFAAQIPFQALQILVSVRQFLSSIMEDVFHVRHTIAEIDSEGRAILASRKTQDMTNQGGVFRPFIVSNGSWSRHGSGLLGILYRVELSPDRTHSRGEAMAPVLGKDLLDLRFDGTYAAFIHPIPIHEVTDLAAIAFGDRNATGVAVELPSRADEGHLRALEPTGGDFELVMKLRLVVIQPALWRLARKEVGHGFHPCPII